MPTPLFSNEAEAKEFGEPGITASLEEDIEGIFLELIDYTPRSKVEIHFKNSSTLTFFYWTSPKDFFKLWNSIKGNKVSLIVCDHRIVSFNKKDVLYKSVCSFALHTLYKGSKTYIRLY